MATLITEDGNEKEVLPANGKEFSLDELNKLVKGYIEIIRLDSKNLIVINEEGKLMEMKVNRAATAMAKHVLFEDVIVGPALFATTTEVT